MIGYSNANIYTRTLQEWCDDGTFINTDTIYSSNTLEVSSLSSNDNGFLAIGMTAQAPVSFGNGVSVNCSTERSSAVIALKYDPDLLVPYVKIPDYQKPSSQLRIWPNPASGFISADCGDMLPNTILLFDVNGRELRRISCNNNLAVISLVGFPAGTYLLKAVSSDGTTAVGRFVKAE